MKTHQLVLRFALEVITLGMYGMIGSSWEGYSLLGALGLPLGVLLIWGLFTVPNDPSRGDAKGIHVSGWIRLCIETLVFGLAIAVMFSRAPYISAGVLAAVFYHYFATQERIKWLLKQK